MSKYTTEVRYICESYAGLTESVGFNSVNEIIDNAIPKIFNASDIPMFEGETAEHRSLLFRKILLHYYSREIGYETVGLWKLKLNTKLMEIMPYYNQLYESELVKYDPLKNVDNTHTHEGAYNDDEKVDNVRDTVDNAVAHTAGTSETDEDITLRHSKTTSRGNDTKTNIVNSNQDTWTLFSDTPQGGINGIANASNGSVSDDSYLTTATHVINTPDGQTITDTYGNIVETYNQGGDKKDNTHSVTEVDSTTTNDKTGKVTDDNTRNQKGTDEYENKELGKIGVETYPEMIEKWRKSFLNIDMMVINELEPLFMQLW